VLSLAGNSVDGAVREDNGVYRNVAPNGGWPTFHNGGAEAHTLTVALDAAGYRTALIGKYLNGFSLAEDATSRRAGTSSARSTTRR